MIKKVAFSNATHENIQGILKEKEGNAPLLIVCHGYKSSKNHPAIESITDKLYEMGVSTFSFNFSKSAQGTNIIKQVSDINDILNHFSDHKNIFLLAGSFSALSSVIAASKLPQIKGLITVNGFFGSKHLGGELFRIYLLFRILILFKKSYRDNWKFLKKNYQPEKITIQTLVIHARHDADVFILQSKNFFNKVAGEKEFHVLESGDHHLTRESYRKETAEVINRWLKAF